MVGMPGFFDFTRQDKDASGAEVDAQTRLELRRLANLFLVAAVTMLALFFELFAKALGVTFIPGPIHSVVGLVFLVGWAATVVYGVFVTYTARRWGWLVLCVVPPTGPPAALAYAWIRRQEIEREVLGAGPSSPTRQRRAGRRKR